MPSAPRHALRRSTLLAAVVLAPAAAAHADPRPSDAPTSRSPIRYTIPASTVAAALTAEGLPISAGQLALAVPLTASTPNPTLHIAAADPRPDGTLQLRVTCRSAVECLPFFVTVTAADGTDLLAQLASRQTASRAVAALHQHPAGISTGAHITLELTDHQMRIHLPAIAIDTGVPGAEVRVASLDRKQTWRGVVIDSTTVKGGLQ